MHARTDLQRGNGDFDSLGGECIVAGWSPVPIYEQYFYRGFELPADMLCSRKRIFLHVAALLLLGVEGDD